MTRHLKPITRHLQLDLTDPVSTVFDLVLLRELPVLVPSTACFG